MGNKNNKKVPMAILSCFLIAFILQGILKISGIFVFEKALSWEIFKIIDNYKCLQIIYYSIIAFISVYCLSFALNSRCYSNKWYHYVVIAIFSITFATIRDFTNTIIVLEYLSDIILYVAVPIFINLTTNNKYRIFKHKDLNSIVLLISMQISLYFTYLGLCYWSSMLSSFIITSQIRMYASSMFLVFFEMYTGLALLMLSLNNFIKKYKEDKND